MDQEDCLQLRFLKMVNFTGESQLLYHSQSLEPDSLHLTTKYFSPVSHSNIFQIFFKYFSNMSVSQFQSFFQVVLMILLTTGILTTFSGMMRPGGPRLGECIRRELIMPCLLSTLMMFELGVRNTEYTSRQNK